jgi:predicted dehydrogenase
MKKIRAGIIGMGYIGISHIEAVRRIGFGEVAAVADVNYDLAKQKAAQFGIPKTYATVDEILADPEIDIIHNCTPTNLHLEINEKIIRAGKHLFSEKPLAMNSSQSKKLIDLLSENKKIVAGINFLYRMYPLVQDMKNRIKAGEIGKVHLVQGSYLQDWLLYDTDYNWRIEPEVGGDSRCMADIGSHWIDCVQTVTGSKITKVCADLVTVYPVRKKPKGQVETFSLNKNMEYEEKEVRTEDFGTVLFELENGAHGMFCASEVSAGRGCFQNFELSGDKASMYWNQERSDEMWMGYRDKPNSLVKRNPNHLTEAARQYSYLAGGHPEGWNDAMLNNVLSVYRYISEGKTPDKDECDFATFEEGHYLVKVIEAILKSNKEKRWINV